MFVRAVSVVLACQTLCACGGDDDADALSTGASSSSGGPLACATGVAIPTEQCIEPGIPPDDCAAGFVADGRGGCTPVLPADACPPGAIAIPGDLECREVADCGTSTWGTIPVDADTEHVDGAYSGTDSDGTAARPWKTIGDGIVAAQPGAVVALAEGDYAEDLLVTKPVRLWGRCPGMVGVVGQGAPAAVFVHEAQGVELRGLSIRGPAAGLVGIDTLDLHVESVWIHDTGSFGFYVGNENEAASATVLGALVESTRDVGLFGYGADIEVVETAVRDSRPTSGGLYGRGIDVQVNLETKTRGRGTLRSILVERSGSEGIYIGGADVAIERVVVRDTVGQDLAVASYNGAGITVETPFGDPSVVTIADCVIERSMTVGVVTCSSSLTLDRTVVRGVAANPAAPDLYRAIGAQHACRTYGAPATLTVRASLVEGPGREGIIVFGSDLVVEDTIVRGIEGAPLQRGAHAQHGLETDTASNMTIRGSLFEDLDGFGAVWLGASGLIEQSVVRDVRPTMGLFGDGVAVSRYGAQDAHVDVSDTSIEGATRAGVSAFGATIVLTNVALTCDAIPLVADFVESSPAVFEDAGGNRCSCGDVSNACAVATTEIAPPEPSPAL